MAAELSCAAFAAGRCVSCTELELPYAEQLARKVAWCEQLLGEFFVDREAPRWLEPEPSMLRDFRNKAKFVVTGPRGNLTLGLVGPRGPVDLTGCPIQVPAVNAAGRVLRQFLNSLPLTGYDVQRRRGDLKFVHVTAAPSGQLLVRFVVQSLAAAQRLAQHAAALRAHLPQAQTATVNILPEHRAVLEGDEEYVLWGQGLRVDFPALQLQLLPRSFFQTNTPVAAALYQQARSWADQLQPRTVLDLYCGVGGFALHLAQPKQQATRRVIGVELSTDAVRAAKRSARAQQLAASFVAADATAYALHEAEVPELLIVNPPRRGLGERLCGWIAQAAPAHVIYSSCNPESLATDLVRLAGYRIVEAKIFDMFAHTKHLECAVLLRRVE